MTRPIHCYEKKSSNTFKDQKIVSTKRINNSNR
nr:MAG TPA: hypothetical protein [Caudoviricetes sp.]